MNIQARRRLRLLALALGAMTLLAAPARAAEDQGTETALLITSVFTIGVVALILFILLLPEEDRTAMTAAFQRARAYFIPSKSERVTEFDHEYDGIRELDNRIPPWFTTLFLVTVLFAVIYMLDYHVFRSSPLMAGEYQQEIAQADLQRRVRVAQEGTIDESALVALTDPEALQSGHDQFKKYCVSCHGAQGQGLVGPNLTDRYWIHGGTIRDVYTTIKHGVPEKGMISWQLVFTPKQIQQIASYVLSLQGTNPPGAKQPEGKRAPEPQLAGT
jgi:cytochrome c oxidase cbb3-type subunit 3